MLPKNIPSNAVSNFFTAFYITLGIIAFFLFQEVFWIMIVVFFLLTALLLATGRIYFRRIPKKEREIPLDGI